MGWGNIFYEFAQIKKVISCNNKIEKLDNSVPIVAKDVQGYPSGITDLDNVEEGSLWFVIEDE
jgi:hypothetical protein